MASYTFHATRPYQRGGRSGVRTWLALLLLGVALLSGAANVYQYRHHVVIQFVAFNTACTEDGPGSSDNTTQTL